MKQAAMMWNCLEVGSEIMRKKSARKCVKTLHFFVAPPRVFATAVHATFTREFQVFYLNTYTAQEGGEAEGNLFNTGAPRGYFGNQGLCKALMLAVFPKQPVAFLTGKVLLFSHVNLYCFWVPKSNAVHIHNVGKL